LTSPGIVCAQGIRSSAVGGESGGAVGYVPPALQDVGIEEKRNAQIPLTLTFTNESGRSVRLSELIKDRPVILQLGDFECRMLCGLIAEGCVESIAGLVLELGKDFDVIRISISPDETDKIAALKKRSFLLVLD